MSGFEESTEAHAVGSSLYREPDRGGGQGSREDEGRGPSRRLLRTSRPAVAPCVFESHSAKSRERW